MHDIPLDVLSGRFKDTSFSWTWNLASSHYRGGYLAPSTQAQNTDFQFHLHLGPAFSLWNVSAVFDGFTDGGRLSVHLLKLNEDDDVDTWDNPKGLISRYELGAVDFSSSVGYFEGYDAGGPTVNNDQDVGFRIGSGNETDLTEPTVSTDGDSLTALDTGPGLYALRFIVDTHHASSSGYKFQLSALAVYRVDGHAFP